jgi:hypothetical protein
VAVVFLLLPFLERHVDPPQVIWKLLLVASEHSLLVGGAGHSIHAVYQLHRLLTAWSGPTAGMVVLDPHSKRSRQRSACVHMLILPSKSA